MLHNYTAMLSQDMRPGIFVFGLRVRDIMGGGVARLLMLQQCGRHSLLPLVQIRAYLVIRTDAIVRSGLIALSPSIYTASCCYDNHCEVLWTSCCAHSLHHERVQLCCGQVEVAVIAETAL